MVDVDLVDEVRLSEPVFFINFWKVNNALMHLCMSRSLNKNQNVPKPRCAVI